MDSWIDINADPAHVKREREKARLLRRTDWWRALVAKGVCHYCHRNVARGGRSTRGNCVPCCRDCNAKKGAQTTAEQILDQLFPEG